MNMKNKYFGLIAAAIIAVPSSLVPFFSVNASTAPNSPATAGTSLNWSGYTATGGTFTSVGATWAVPASTAPAGTSNALSADATWVGIGGVSTKDLIQAGTQTVFQDGQSGTPSYEAWYEMLPDSSEYIPLTIHPGDLMTVSIAEQSGGTWEISFTDHTTGQSYSTSVSYQSSLSSAEWIEEMPSDQRSFVALDNFGTASFTNAFSIENGVQVTMEGANAQPLTMINGANQALATPSPLGADGASFAVTRTGNIATTATVTPGSGNARSAGRWSRTGVGVQGYTAPTRTFRSAAASGTASSETSGIVPATANIGYGAGYGRFSFGNFSVFFRTFEDNMRWTQSSSR
jgi:hypothetical protein